MPQTAFYSIKTTCFRRFVLARRLSASMKLLRAEIPGIRLGTSTGLALASAFLAKISNLPLLAVAFAAVILKIAAAGKIGKTARVNSVARVVIFLRRAADGGWLAWCKINFGDFTGSAAKIQMLGWTLKPFGEWWHHPIFTPHGFWIFISGADGDFLAGGIFLARPAAGIAGGGRYLCGFVRRFCCRGRVALPFAAPAARTGPQRQALWLGFWSFIAVVAFLGFLSIIYDFRDCVRPVARTSVFHIGPADSRRADSVSCCCLFMELTAH